LLIDWSMFVMNYSSGVDFVRSRDWKNQNCSQQSCQQFPSTDTIFESWMEIAAWSELRWFSKFEFPF
jgi:hypothetical protein